MSKINELFDFVKIQLQQPAEIIGSYIWVNPQSEEVKKVLEEEGFKYSKNRMLWYYAEPRKRRYYKRYSMDELRNMYSKNKVVPK